MSETAGSADRWITGTIGGGGAELVAMPSGDGPSPPSGSVEAVRGGAASGSGAAEGPLAAVGLLATPRTGVLRAGSGGVDATGRRNTGWGTGGARVTGRGAPGPDRVWRGTGLGTSYSTASRAPPSATGGDGAGYTSGVGTRGLGPLSARPGSGWRATLSNPPTVPEGPSRLTRWVNGRTNAGERRVLRPASKAAGARVRRATRRIGDRGASCRHSPLTATGCGGATAGSLGCGGRAGWGVVTAGATAPPRESAP